MKDFRGKVVAITGAGSGIGRALAMAFAARGARLAISDVDEAGLGETAALLRAKHADVHDALVDVRDRAAVFTWARAVVDAFGAAHLVINNAGVSLHAPVAEMPIDELRRVMDINFYGVVHGTQAFLPHLEAAGEGHVVNVSSIFGIMAAPAQSAYNSAKFAVRGFTESLRMELELAGSSVRATCVHPGGIDTNIVRSSHQAGSGPLSRDRQSLVDEFHGTLARTSPDQCAEAIVEAVRGGRRRVMVGLDAQVLDRAVRWFPSAYQGLAVRLMRRRAR